MIKVLLADDHSIVRAGLWPLFEANGDLEIIAEAADWCG
jgi:two-component system invasion response regulator UvrY